MQLMHALADAGMDGSEYFVECTCGMRSWGDTDGDALENYFGHKRLALPQLD
jgi:hypothetical protein